jgi:hypothetical protein
VKSRLALPFVWLATVVLIAAQAISMHAVEGAYGKAQWITHRYGLWVLAACLVFAIVYSVLRLSAFQRRLAWAHFLVSAAGYAINIVMPTLVLRILAPPPPYGDYSAAMASIEVASSVGYAGCLVGLALFFWVLIDAAVRGQTAGRRSTSA